MANHLSYPLIIAHRGGSGHAPENTLTAFQTAIDQGADGIELDVHLSADGEVVVIHDSDLGRTTNGSGSVYQKLLSEIKQLDAGSWFDEGFSGEEVPTLSEVFELVGKQCLINIELKGPGLFRSKLPDKVVEIVRQYDLEEQIIYSSFNPWQLRKIGKLLPSAKLGLLLPPGILAVLVRVLSKLVVTPWGYHPHFQSVTEDFIRFAGGEARPILAWTVNQPADLAQLCANGIYGIITDYPSRALEKRMESIQ